LGENVDSGHHVHLRLPDGRVQMSPGWFVYQKHSHDVKLIGDTNHDQTINEIDVCVEGWTWP
jgi:hypothetical protein